MSERYMVRHFLAALAYRFRKAVDSAPDGFGAFEAGHGIRTPLAIVHHVNGVLGYGCGVLETGDADYWHKHPELDWAGEVALVHETLRRIDTFLAEGESVETGRR